MADLLRVSQAEVSKRMRRTELYGGTLRKVIEAMNGDLVIAARFADRVDIPIRVSGGRRHLTLRQTVRHVSSGDANHRASARPSTGGLMPSRSLARAQSRA